MSRLISKSCGTRNTDVRLTANFLDVDLVFTMFKFEHFKRLFRGIKEKTHTHARTKHGEKPNNFINDVISMPIHSQKIALHQ